MAKIKIELTQLLIRTLESGDAQKMFSLVDLNRDRIQAFLPITASENESLRLTRAYLERKQIEARNDKVYTCVIVEKATQMFAGFLVIKEVDQKVGSCEFGYFVDRHYEGQGVISRAVKAVVEYCFETLKLSLITIVTSPANAASIHVAEKNGFIKTAFIPDGHTDAEGNKHDVLRYELKNR